MSSFIRPTTSRSDLSPRQLYLRIRECDFRGVLHSALPFACLANTTHTSSVDLSRRSSLTVTWPLECFLYSQDSSCLTQTMVNRSAGRTEFVSGKRGRSCLLGLFAFSFSYVLVRTWFAPKCAHRRFGMVQAWNPFAPGSHGRMELFCMDSLTRGFLLPLFSILIALDVTPKLLDVRCIAIRLLVVSVLAHTPIRGLNHWDGSRIALSPRDFLNFWLACSACIWCGSDTSQNAPARTRIFGCLGNTISIEFAARGYGFR